MPQIKNASPWPTNREFPQKTLQSIHRIHLLMRAPGRRSSKSQAGSCKLVTQSGLSVKQPIWAVSILDTAPRANARTERLCCIRDLATMCFLSAVKHPCPRAVALQDGRALGVCASLRHVHMRLRTPLDMRTQQCRSGRQYLLLGQANKHNACIKYFWARRK